MRESLHMSQQNVADGIGITRQYYQQIENGERQKKMDMPLLEKISTVLSQPLSVLIEKEKENSL